MTEEHLPPRRTNPSLADTAAERTARLRELDLADVPDERFDAFARQIVESTGALAAMVNLVGDRKMYFAGLAVKQDLGPADPVLQGDPGREMDVDRGFCPHVVTRRKALVLDDVFAYPRFAGNPVVDELGVRAYLGAPLIDDDGVVLGTVCAVDPSPHSGAEDAGWGHRGLEAIKRIAAEVVAEIRSRRRLGDLTAAAPGAVMIVTDPGLEVLHANAAHEQLFGPVERLGAVAASSFPDLSGVGLQAALEQVRRSGTAAATAPVRLAADGRTVLFAAVPVSVPGHPHALLTLGMLDAEPAHCTAEAIALAESIGKLCD
jgi:GAF domain